MPKAKFKKRNGGASHDASSPYAAAAKPPASGVSSHNIFRMKTDMGQHVLKNPGVARAIVDKADLKQSDVCVCGRFSFCSFRDFCVSCEEGKEGSSNY